MKKVVMFLSALILALTFTGCDNKNDSTNKPEEPAYKMVTVNTHGNLYLVGPENFEGGLSALKGKTIAAFGMGAVPDLTLKVLLNKNSVEYVQTDGTDIDEKKVNIRYLGAAVSDASSAYVSKQYDFALLAEPAASAALNNRADGKRIFDLQELYGESGYPQAVMLVKTAFLNDYPAFVNDFIAAMTQNETWLAENTAAAVTAINANGGTSLKAPALTPAALANSNIKTVYAAQLKTVIKAYINDVKTVAPAAVGDLPDSFFPVIDKNAQNKSESPVTVKVFTPDGAPALALGKLMAQELNFSQTVIYTVVDASMIGAKVAGKEADIAIIPVTAASKLFGAAFN